MNGFLFVLLCVSQLPYEGYVRDPLFLKINELASDEFNVRQAATHELKDMEEALVPLVKLTNNIKLMKEEADLRDRIHFILQHHISRFKPKKYTQIPWIDCLPLDYPDREKVIKKSMQPEWYIDFVKTKAPGNFEGLRYGTEMLIFDLLKKNTSKEKIIQLLDRMAEIEIEWIKTGGKYKNPEFIDGLKEEYKNGRPTEYPFKPY